MKHKLTSQIAKELETVSKILPQFKILDEVGNLLSENVDHINGLHNSFYLDGYKGVKKYCKYFVELHKKQLKK